MDPLAALIGGGISAIGGFFGQRSQNQFNMQMAQGAYLPGLVRNAQAAGINPLAVLPGRGFSGSNALGEGLMSAGRQVSQIDPFSQELKRYGVEAARLGVEGQNIQLNNQVIQNAIQREAYERLQRNPQLQPPGWGEPTVPGMVEKGLRDWGGFTWHRPEWSKNIPTIPWADWMKTIWQPGRRSEGFM